MMIQIATLQHLRFWDKPTRWALRQRNPSPPPALRPCDLGRRPFGSLLTLRAAESEKATEQTTNLLFTPMAPLSAPGPPNSTLCVPPIGVLPTVYCNGLPTYIHTDTRRRFNGNFSTRTWVGSLNSHSPFIPWLYILLWPCDRVSDLRLRGLAVWW